MLVVSDALRQDVLGCYGGAARTPNINRLAQQGVVFENAYTTSPWTPPSAVSIFTGNYATSYPSSPLQNTIMVHVPDEEVLCAEVLRDLGYDTAIVNESAQAGLHNCFQGFNPPAPDRRVAARRTLRQILNTRIHHKGSIAILDYLLRIPKERNFFVAHWMLDPHEPFSWNRFTKDIAVDESKLTKPAGQYTSRKKIDGALNDEETRYLKARYIAEVESVDERIGFVQTLLKHRQLADNTYLILTSDHGELFGEHDLFGHGVNYFQELLRVPLVIAGPELPRGRTIKAAVSLVGLMKTIKELLGVEYVDNMQGESFRNVIFNDSVEGRTLYFDDVREHTRVDALLLNNFKLVARSDGTNELYDLVHDPRELDNVAAGHGDKVQAMSESLLAQREANAKRHAANLARFDGSELELSEEEEQKLRKELRSLGYIQ
ncbi:MAG: sulfatase-like hydrolase/transferase [Gammaproteobacteria bacterium]|nr:sulfatase-like hydrolase/transferase [Gammaproteobacteria bacterium]